MQPKALFAGCLLFVPLLHPGFPAGAGGAVFATEGKARDLAVCDGKIFRRILGKEPHPGLGKRSARLAVEDIALDHGTVLAGNGDVPAIIESLLQCVEHFRVAAQNRSPAFQVLVLRSRRQLQRVRIDVTCSLAGHARVSSICGLLSPEICTSDGDEWPENCEEFSRSRAPRSWYLSKRVARTAEKNPLQEPNISLTEDGSYPQLTMQLAHFGLPEAVL